MLIVKCVCHTSFLCYFHQLSLILAHLYIIPGFTVTSSKKLFLIKGYILHIPLLTFSGNDDLIHEPNLSTLSFSKFHLLSHRTLSFQGYFCLSVDLISVLLTWESPIRWTQLKLLQKEARIIADNRSCPSSVFLNRVGRRSCSAKVRPQTSAHNSSRTFSFHCLKMVLHAILLRIHHLILQYPTFYWGAVVYSVHTSQE